MVEIRCLKNNDLLQLLDLYKHLHRADSPMPPQEEVEAIWETAMADPKINYFGAYHHEKLIASCTMAIIPNLTRSCRSYGIIENVVTHADYRRKGMGKKVIEAALKIAWQANCYKVVLTTSRDSKSVHQFYESIGFDRNDKQAFVARPLAD